MLFAKPPRETDTSTNKFSRLTLFCGDILTKSGDVNL